MLRSANLFILFVSFLIIESKVNCDEDETRTSVDLIKSRGFKPETHFVTTDDGYVLTLHRIIHPFLKGPKTPVFLQHGIIATSSCFMIASAGEPMVERGKVGDERVGNNLAFELANRGYDVWLGNTRGNIYSRNHTVLKESNPDFWAFTLNEMAEYDIPSSVDYVLSYTNYSSLGYIGHSQGTALMFALLSERPEFEAKIKPFIAIAPVTTLSYTKSPIVHLADNYLFNLLLRQKGEIFITNKLMSAISKWACKSTKVDVFNKTLDLNILCKNLVFAIVGYNPEQLDAERLNVYMHHLPAGASNWNLLHFLQIVARKEFAKFDYGATENLRHYGQTTPPVFKLQNIRSKHIALIYSENDLLADLKDVEALKSKLEVPLFNDYLVPNRYWNHLDFLFGKEAGLYVNSKVLQILGEFD